MNGLELLALALELWTAIGLLGLAVSLVRRERRKLWQGVGSLVGVWVVYLVILLVVSARQPEQRVPIGKPACFHSLCFVVERVEEIPGFPIRNNERLVRLTVQMTNHGKSEAQEDVRAYLRDAQGRMWPQSEGISGNPLSGRVVAGGTVVSEPVFQVAPEASGLGLVMEHGRWSRLRLVMGDGESWRHRARVMVLDR